MLLLKSCSVLHKSATFKSSLTSTVNSLCNILQQFNSDTKQVSKFNFGNVDMILYAHTFHRGLLIIYCCHINQSVCKIFIKCNFSNSLHQYFYGNFNCKCRINSEETELFCIFIFLFHSLLLSEKESIHKTIYSLLWHLAVTGNF